MATSLARHRLGARASAASSSWSSRVVVLCGSVYLMLATNIGARLGFLLAVAGLFGWMMLMGIVWAIYGIGLKGREPTWKAVPGRTGPAGHGRARPGRRARRPARRPRGRPRPPDDGHAASTSVFVDEGWRARSPRTTRRSARPSAARRHVPRGDRRVRRRRVHRRSTCSTSGGERYPKISDRFDFIGLLPQAALRRRRGRSR